MLAAGSIGTARSGSWWASALVYAGMALSLAYIDVVGMSHTVLTAPAAVVVVVAPVVVVAGIVPGRRCCT